MVALSDTIVFDKNLRLIKRRSARMNASSDKLVTTSKWTALVFAHVNRQM